MTAFSLPWYAAIGVNAVPTYVLDDKYGIVGAEAYEVFEQVLAKLEEERAGE